MDDEDYDWLRAFRWHADQSRNTFYAKRGHRPGIKMHRQILGLMAGEFCDHINGNGLDNRRDNLRIASVAENRRNAGKLSTNRSGYKGVSYYKPKGTWRATIYKAGKNVLIGEFDNVVSAAIAYDVACRAAHGDFAYTNFVSGARAGG